MTNMKLALIGGRGWDILAGGDGLQRGDGEADEFVFKSIAQIGKSASQRDLIMDFETGLDSIDLSAIDANKNMDGNQEFTFIGTGEFTAAGQLRYEVIAVETMDDLPNSSIFTELNFVLPGRSGPVDIPSALDQMSIENVLVSGDLDVASVRL